MMKDAVQHMHALSGSSNEFAIRTCPIPLSIYVRGPHSRLRCGPSFQTVGRRATRAAELFVEAHDRYAHLFSSLIEANYKFDRFLDIGNSRPEDKDHPRLGPGWLAKGCPASMAKLGELVAFVDWLGEWRSTLIQKEKAKHTRRRDYMFMLLPEQLHDDLVTTALSYVAVTYRLWDLGLPEVLLRRAQTDRNERHFSHQRSNNSGSGVSAERANTNFGRAALQRSFGFSKASTMMMMGHHDDGPSRAQRRSSLLMYAKAIRKGGKRERNEGGFVVVDGEGGARRRGQKRPRVETYPGGGGA